MSYARGTQVSESTSRAEVERLLTRYGCSSFGSGWDQDTQSAHITFRHGETSIMLGLQMPNVNEFRETPSGRRRKSQVEVEQAYYAERRRRWRALLLILKAKLEAVSSGISTLEHEFLADVLLPNGLTLGSWAIPKLSLLQSGALALPEKAGPSR